MNNDTEFFSRFNSKIRVCPEVGLFYDVRVPTQAEKDYFAEEQKVCETLSEHYLEKWYETHEIPSPEFKSRRIPDNEDWDTVDMLMGQSLNANMDLLWERYKNNTFSFAENSNY
jgi:hypothetical protein